MQANDRPNQTEHVKSPDSSDESQGPSDHQEGAFDDSSLTDEEWRKLLQPDPTELQALTLLQKYYCRDNEKASILQRLDSYDDCNFKVQVGDRVCLLKIHNGVESQDLIQCSSESEHDFYQEGHMKSVIHLQNAIMELCAENDLVSNQPIRPVHPSSPDVLGANSPVVVTELPVLSQRHSPRTLAVRLLSWTTGRPMSSVSNLGIETLASAGRILGMLDKTLDHLNVNSLNGALDKFGSSGSLLGRGSMVNLRASISHKAAPPHPRLPNQQLPMDRFRLDMMSKSAAGAKRLAPTAQAHDISAVLDDSLLIPARRYHQWDGKNTVDLRKFTDYIADERRRHLVLSVIDAFQRELLDSGAASHFRVGVIHGDFNDANILVDDSMKVCGVIDFGDSIER